MDSNDYFEGKRFLTHKWVVDVYKAILEKNLDILYRLDCIGSQFLTHGCHEGIDTQAVTDVVLHVDNVLARYKYDPWKKS